jgi:hypothetical protein
MYYLEDLTIREIKFLDDLLSEYRNNNESFVSSLPPYYHTLKKKLKRLCKFVSYNPAETDTPKSRSKYSVLKQLKK